MTWGQRAQKTQETKEAHHLKAAEGEAKTVSANAQPRQYVGNKGNHGAATGDQVPLGKFFKIHCILQEKIGLAHECLL
jgi:hypothetical protein